MPTSLADIVIEPTPTTTATTSSTTTTTTTTTTLPPNAAAEFGFTQVVFGESSFVVITNWGNAPGNLEGYWLCQFPSYEPLPRIELAPGEQALIGLAPDPPPELAGMATIVDLGPAIGLFNADSGEVALYRDQAFDDPESMIAYVEWGEPGHPRAEVAIAAGLWDDSAVDVFDEAPSISSGVHPATSSSVWFADVGG